MLAERIIKRREAAAVRAPVFFRRTSFGAHNDVVSSSASSILSSPRSLPTSLSSSMYPGVTASMSYSSTAGMPRTNSLADSILGSVPFLSNTAGAAALSIANSDDQSDLSRLTNTLRAVVEGNERCWRGDECELSRGVRSGLETTAMHCQRHAELSETRVYIL